MEPAPIFSHSLIADIPYTVDTGEPLVNETFGPDDISRRRTGTQVPRPMTIHNGRSLASEFLLDVHGFAFVEHRTRVSDFFDTAQLESVYYPEVQKLIREVSGASRVVVFDDTLLSGEGAER